MLSDCQHVLVLIGPFHVCVYQIWRHVCTLRSIEPLHVDGLPSMWVCSALCIKLLLCRDVQVLFTVHHVLQNLRTFAAAACCLFVVTQHGTSYCRL